MTLPESHSRFHLPSSIRLLITPGVRGHTLTFTIIMAFLFATAYASRALGAGQAWTVVFALGASMAGTYLVFSLLTLPEKTRRLIFYTPMKTRIIILAIVFGPTLGGVAYWIQQAGSVEALPIFPAFLVIFYGWILLQAYFIAAPVSQLLTRVETAITGDGHAKKLMRGLGTTVLFLPIAPLVYSVWVISSWLSSTYQNIQDANGKIITWTILVTVVLLFTYFLTLRWGWRSIKQNAPQAALFAGGTFLVLWGYLLYRATTVAMGYITQNQPSNPLLDTGLMVVSIVGAMQTFARKTISKADRRWSQVLPFLVFAFGSIYAVAQFYFILQVAINRAELSIAVNLTVFATGILTMMYLVRKHLLSAGSTSVSTQPRLGQSLNQPPPTGGTKRSLFHLPWPKRRNSAAQPGSNLDTSPRKETGNEGEQNVNPEAEQEQEHPGEDDASVNLKHEVQQFLEENRPEQEEEQEQPLGPEEEEFAEQNLEESGDPDY